MLPAHQHFVFNTDETTSAGGPPPDPLTSSDSPMYSVLPGGGPHAEAYTMGGTSTTPTIGLSSSVGSGNPLTMNNLPPFIALNYLIKT